MLNRRVVLRCFIVFMLPVTANAVSTDASQESSLCGVHLRPQVVALRREIEQFYKHPFECEEADLSNEGEKGHASSLNGIPKVVVDTFAGRQELTITHEMLHIYLGMHGFQTNPYFKWTSPPYIAASRYKFAVSIIYANYQHVYIFHMMRNMGFDPDSMFRDESLAMPIRPQNLFNPEQAAYDLWRLRMNYPKEAKIFEKRLMVAGYGKQVELTDKLEAIAHKYHPSDTQTALKALGESLAVLYSPQTRYYEHP
jgi:hypothetical protein